MCGDNYSHVYDDYPTTYSGVFSNGVISGNIVSDNGGSGCFTLFIDSLSLYGCTDPSATNYDSLAIFNNGSCCYVSSTNLQKQKEKEKL